MASIDFENLALLGKNKDLLGRSGDLLRIRAFNGVLLCAGIFLTEVKDL